MKRNIADITYFETDVRDVVIMHTAAGGYGVRRSGDAGEYHPLAGAFTTKTDLLAWLDEQLPDDPDDFPRSVSASLQSERDKMEAWHKEREEELAAKLKSDDSDGSAARDETDDPLPDFSKAISSIGGFEWQGYKFQTSRSAAPGEDDEEEVNSTDARGDDTSFDLSILTDEDRAGLADEMAAEGRRHRDEINWIISEHLDRKKRGSVATNYDNHVDGETPDEGINRTQQEMLNGLFKSSSHLDILHNRGLVRDGTGPYIVKRAKEA